MKPSVGKTQGEESLRQSMSWLHTWSGLIFGWLLFAMFLTGTLSFFRHEITRWMQPEIQTHVTSDPESVELAQHYLTEHAPGARLWFITPPNDREPVIQLLVFERKPGENGFARITLNPQTGQIVKGRETRGGEFFYRFHYRLQMADPWSGGRLLAGIAAMFMLVAIISGIITHKKIFADFFTFRPKKGGSGPGWMATTRYRYWDCRFI